MKKTSQFFFLLLLLVFSNHSFAAPSRNLTIFAEQNMVLPLTKISRIFSQKSNVIVSINFNSSAELIRDIDLGEPANLFISAHPNWIETLKQKGLVDVYNIGYIAYDRLVLVTSSKNDNIPPELLKQNLGLKKALQILSSNKISLITDSDSGTSGLLENDFSKNLQEDSSLAGLEIFKKLEEDRTSVLNTLKDNPEQYALTLNSQLGNKKDYRVLAQEKENIFYQALVIAGDNMETAREFLRFLKSDTAKSILRDSGFIVD